MSFVLQPSPYEQIPQLLKTTLPEYTQAEEYRLHEDNSDDLPGVLLASLANFLARRSLEAPDSEVVRIGLAVASTLWRSNDERTLEAMRDEFFAALENRPDARPIMLSRMEPLLRDGYERWSASS